MMPPKAIEPRNWDHKPTAEGALCVDNSFNATDDANYTGRERKSGSAEGQRMV